MEAVKIIILCLLSAVLLAGCAFSPQREQAPMKTEFFAMDTYVSFTAYGDVSEGVMDAAKREVGELEDLWSVTKETSEVYELNHANGNTTVVSEETAALLRFSLDMAAQTDGALDITLYPVLTAWGFTTGSYQIPTDDELAAKMQLVGYEKVSLAGNTVTLMPGMQVDFGAVAKGYACDMLKELFESQGVTSAIISLGGNIQTIGSKPDGAPWRVSVEHPENRDSLGILSVTDKSVVTSGAYERYFDGADGKRYGHILDPKTGKPVNSDLLSVTVIGAESKQCDALATAFYVMGVQRAVEFLGGHPEIDALLFTQDGELYLTKGAADSFTLSENYGDIPLKEINR